jgi:hypothetical protein
MSKARNVTVTWPVDLQTYRPSRQNCFQNNIGPDMLTLSAVSDHHVSSVREFAALSDNLTEQR